MPDTLTQSHLVSFPAGLFSALSGIVAARLPAAEAAAVLREAGYMLGGTLWNLLEEHSGAAPDALAERDFWQTIGEVWQRNGWGRLSHSSLHPGVGGLDVEGGFEANPGANATYPSCHLTTGLLAEVLRRVADAPVSVLEAECQSRGDQRCRFLFGSEETLARVYHSAQTAGGYEAAVESLT